MKIYTKTGDKGTTSLLSGTRVSKADMRLEAYGTLDELNSWLGVLAAELPTNSFPLLTKIQGELFSMGSYLALEGEATFPMPKLDPDLVNALERQIDSWNEQLPELKNFMIFGTYTDYKCLHHHRLKKEKFYFQQGFEVVYCQMELRLD